VVSTTRSSACLTFQDAECDFQADKCQQLTRAECDASFQSLFCKSDETASACTKALASATCGTSPPECQGIGDTAPALSLCNQFVDVSCTRISGCGAVDKATCLSQEQAVLSCATAVGVAPSFDSCLAEVNSAACNAQKGIDLPASCKGVIKRLMPTSPGTSPSMHPALDFLAGIGREE
jgi:hypothetical protein